MIQPLGEALTFRERVPMPPLVWVISRADVNDTTEGLRVRLATKAGANQIADREELVPI